LNLEIRAVNFKVDAQTTERRARPLILLGIVLLVVGYVLPVPILATIGIALIAVGVVLLLLGQFSGPVGGRRFWW
jgi:uncharacterized membrane protein HdeD (DUF308 family)